MKGKIAKTDMGTYRMYFPKLLIEEMFGVNKTTDVDIEFPEPGKITIYKKDEGEEEEEPTEAAPVIDADGDSEVE